MYRCSIINLMKQEINSRNSKFMTQKVKKPPSELPRTIKTLSHCNYSKKPYHVHTVASILFNIQSVRPRLTLTRNYSTDNDSDETKHKTADFIIYNFCNFDSLFSVLFLIFLCKDWKKFKEKGQGLIFK